MTPAERLARLRARLAPLAPHARPLLPAAWIGGALLAGAAAGWVATSLVMPAAPAPAALAVERWEAPPAVTSAPAISSEPLGPPAVLARRIPVPGPAHRPSELALLLRAARLAAVAPAPALRHAGPAHRPAELFLLLTAARVEEAPPAAPLRRAGPPHEPAELFLVLIDLEDAIRPRNSVPSPLEGEGQEGGEARSACVHDELAQLDCGVPPSLTLPLKGGGEFGAVAARTLPRAGAAHEPAEFALLLADLSESLRPSNSVPSPLEGEGQEGGEARSACGLGALEQRVCVSPTLTLPLKGAGDLAEGAALPRAGPAHRPAEIALVLRAIAEASTPADDAEVPGYTWDAALKDCGIDEAGQLACGVRSDLTLPLERGDDVAPVAARVLPRPGLPHTMPEVVLLLGRIAQVAALLSREQPLEPDAPAAEAAEASIVRRGAWWIAELAPAAAPQQETKPDAPEPEAAAAGAAVVEPEPAAAVAHAAVANDAQVAITETGPDLDHDAAPVAPAAPDGPPLIAIMIDDLGLNPRRAARVSALPGPLTMAFIPYGEGLEGQVREAAAAGHEIFLHLPMAPVDPALDPGPHALLAGLAPSELARRLDWNLDRFGGYVGVNNHMGSLLTQDPAAMDMLMTELEARGLIFVDSVTTAHSVAYDAALGHDVPAARRDVFLDNLPEIDAVLAQLDALEDLARRRGYAIAIGHPHDATIEALARWLPAAASRGVLLVPASRIIESSELRLAQQAAQGGPAP